MDKQAKDFDLALLLRDLRDIDKAIDLKVFAKNRKELMNYRRNLVKQIESKMSKVLGTNNQFWWER